ncbi:methionyl-tRNA formyltransferase [Mesonia sp. K7]|uniref:methionyl-tRNA formyltransferase n=1 Tax=Mesonia sp. K7 TaxID=2218606 RepID=UPI000DA82E0C|nr:methionyl-tRNA formyltransferase [Mesonia sp. K7]PZD78219.1 methionyl-tRNA formyltransferase [Mesonia sp. K7]
MNRKLRVLFMGTPEFAVSILDKILQENYEVVAAVTAPDKPAGRGQKLHQSAVKKYADKNNLPVLQPTNLKSESFLEDLKKYNPNVIVVVAFRMLPEQVWKYPEFGTFNLHASLLPQYRGAAPINWAIINGESKSGVTTFFIDEKIDTGEIILQKEVAIENDATAGILHDKLMNEGANLVIETLKSLEEDSINTQKQPQSGELKTAYKLNPENTKIDWQKSTTEIYNLIRGLSPYPVAWSYFINENKKDRCKIYSAKAEITEHNIEIGKIIVAGFEMKVSTKDGFIVIEEMQLPGKRKMKIKELLNGFSFEDGATML